GRHLGQGALDLAPDTTDGDAEHALAAGDEVDDLVGRGALVHARAVRHEGDLGEVLDAALTQGGDGGADLLQGDAGVQESLDDLEHEDVAAAVEPVGAGAGGGLDAGLDEPGTGPVVELTVGDAGDVARRGAAVAGRGVLLRQVLTEEETLRSVRDRSACGSLTAGVHCASWGVVTTLWRGGGDFKDARRETPWRVARTGVSVVTSAAGAGPGAASWAAGAEEVLGADVVEEVAEAFDLGLLVDVDDLDAGEGDDLGGAQHGAAGAHGQGDGVGGAGVEVHAVAQHELGEVDAALQGDDLDAFEGDADGAEHVAQQVVGHGPRGGQACLCRGGGAGLAGADDDGDGEVGGTVEQQHDDLLVALLLSHTEDLHGD